MPAERLTLRIPSELLGAVEEAADNADKPRTTWILEAVQHRLGKGAEQRRSYAKAVAAAQQASRGKLNRVDAESVAARVICAFTE